jgi:hypothetical protein
MLGSMHLPEMVFGDNSLELVHEATGIKLHFNAFDALRGWRQEGLPPVEVPAAAKWKFRTYVLAPKFNFGLFVDVIVTLKFYGFVRMTNISLQLVKLGYMIRDYRNNIANNRVFLHFNGTFCRELVPYDFLLIVLDTIPIITFHLWCMLGGSV